MIMGTIGHLARMVNSHCLYPILVNQFSCAQLKVIEIVSTLSVASLNNKLKSMFYLID